MFGKDTENN